MQLFRRKSLAAVLADVGDPNVEDPHQPGLKRQLGASHLVLLGIGAVIGAGIFSLTGHAAADYAGPGIVYSFVLGGILCALAGFCYSELASMIPIAGSAYAYSYTTMGEIIAWIIGWDLVLEYAFGAVTVSVAWSGYLISLLEKTLHLELPTWLAHFTHGPFDPPVDGGRHVQGFFNLPAAFISVVAGSILYRGIREAAWVNNLIVVLKVAIVLSFIGLGFGVISHDNLFVNPDATGLAALVPPAIATEAGVRFGWLSGGVLTGAGVVFFAYVGFDAVSTTAQETRNPQRDLPIGILGSLVVCTLLYVLVAFVLTGVVDYRQLGVPDPIAVGIDRIVELRGWSPAARGSFTFAVKLGALAGLTSVILVLMLGQTRIFYAMARDGLLPWFDRVHPRYQTPHVATSVTTVFVAICGGVLPMSLVGELVSIGTLLAFVLVCLGVPILRHTDPDAPRPFRVRAPLIVGPIGALACAFVMYGLPLDTWLRLLIWLAVGFVVYFGYSRHHSRLAQAASRAPGVQP